MYPCGSTALERSLLQDQLAVRYQVMKRKWQHFLPSAMRMRLNGTDGKLYGCQLKATYSRCLLFPIFFFLLLFVFNCRDFSLFSLNILYVIKLSCWQPSGTLTRDRHRPSNSLRTGQRRSELEWLFWSFRHRSVQLNICEYYCDLSDVWLFASFTHTCLYSLLFCIVFC